MKICIITNLYAPHVRGGAELIAETMAHGFIAAGDSVIIISTKPTAGLSVEPAFAPPSAGLRTDKQASAESRIYRFLPLNIFYYLNDFKHCAAVRLLWHFFDMFNWHSAKVVAGILKNEKPDLVITHNLKGIGLLIPRAIAKLKLKHIHVLHDVQLVIPSGLILKNHEQDFSIVGWPTRIYAGICRWLFRQVGCVVAPSKWLLDFYVRNGFFKNAQQRIICNPVIAVETRYISSLQRTGQFLFVGQIEKHKGVEWLVDIWRRRQFVERLLLVGNGSLLRELQHGYGTTDSTDETTDNTDIKFVGKKMGQELVEMYRAADFLIAPSLCYENSPTVIQSAFQNGVPVIVADIGGAAELVENKKTGFIFPSGDEDALVKILENIKTLSDEDYKKMSKQCLEKSRDWDVGIYIEAMIACRIVGW
ncbi:glycosyltransferase [Candidatus Falkowbacteria bacterium]|nr:glycosyltransferase [Candidatus Falkowbacteria bacterium]